MGLLSRLAKESCANFFSDFGDRQPLRICRLSSCFAMGYPRQRNSDTKIEESSQSVLEFPIFGLLSH